MRASKIRHNLARFRTHLGLSQNEVAACVGVSFSAIRGVENLVLPLSESLAEKLEAVFGIPKEWLLANDLSDPIPELKPKREYSGWEAPWRAKFDSYYSMAVENDIRETLKDAASLRLYWQRRDNYLEELKRLFGRPDLDGDPLDRFKKDLVAFDPYEPQVSRYQEKPPRSRKQQRKSPRRSRATA
jgi:transcriptional regulator with XRE-family HTH domain